MVDNPFEIIFANHTIQKRSDIWDIMSTECTSAFELCPWLKKEYNTPPFFIPQKYADQNKGTFDMLSKVLSYDAVLQQQNVLFVPYTLNDIISSQAWLRAADLFHTLRWHSMGINIRPTIRDYELNNDYCSYLSKNLLPKWASISTGPGEINKKITWLSPQGSDSVTPAKSVRNEISCFIESISHSSMSYSQRTSVYSSSDKHDNTSSNPRPRYYIPFDELPELLLAFSFYSWREKKAFDDANIRVNYRKKKYHQSFESYKRTYEEFYNYYKKRIDEKNLDAWVHLYRSDKMFHYIKLKTICFYYKTLCDRFNDIYGDRIIASYKIPYSDLIGFKEKLISCIFNDEEFITQLLSSPCLDPFYPFWVLFNFDIYTPNPGGSDQDEIFNNINTWKERTIDIVSDCYWFTPIRLTLEDINKDKALFNSIDYWDKDIMNRLSNNKLVHSILNREEFILTQDLPSKIFEDETSRLPIKFDIIKKYMITLSK